jgi:glycosyltransferase involved in cell wall biosynthesis
MTDRTANRRISLTVIVLTYNEEQNLPACLGTIQDWVGEIVIVDSGSTDATVQIAEQAGATVIQHPFETHARQWQWALSNVPGHYEWVLGLDADQRVTPELQAELIRLFQQPGAGLERCEGFFVKRRQIFRGTWIRHGGYYPKYLLKLFRRDRVFIDTQDLMDHHFYVAGKTGKLQHDIIEDNQKEQSIAFWINKHNRYATLHAREEFKRRKNQHTWPLQGTLFGSPDQQIVWLKQRWDRMPLYVRPFLYFFLRYILLLGFLDGKQGFIFHFLQAFWYRLLIDIHLDDQLKEENQQGQYRNVRHSH